MFRLSGLAAMLGGVIGIINIPLLALAYFATVDGAEFAYAPSTVAAWVAVAQPPLKPLLFFATADEVYLTDGKVMLLVFLGMLAGLLALHARQRFYLGLLEKIGFWVTLVSALPFLCNVIGYWLTLWRSLTGQAQNRLVTVFSTLTIAALFTPLRRHVQARIDRRFYQRKYDAEQVLAVFMDTVRSETDLNKLTEHLVVVIEETLQPTRVSLWLRKTERSQ